MRYLITHGHIFKNAGSTFDDSLQNAFAEAFYDHRDDAAMLSGGAKYLNKLILSRPDLLALSSHHLCNPLPISDEYVCLPVYFIRHPIERILSVYSFERKQNADTPGAIAAAKYSLLDYIKWRFDSQRHLVISNYQVAYIGAQHQITLQKPAGLKELKACIAKHQQENCFFGVVDEFGKSFSKFRSYVKEYFPDIEFNYKIQNVTSADSYGDKLVNATRQLEPVLDLLYSMNTYDLALYDYIKALYSIDDTPSVGPVIEPDVSQQQIDALSMESIEITNENLESSVSREIGKPKEILTNLPGASK